MIDDDDDAKDDAQSKMNLLVLLLLCRSVQCAYRSNNLLSLILARAASAFSIVPTD